MNEMSGGSEAYVPERKRSPFVNSAQGGRALSALQLPLFAVRPPPNYAILTTTGRRTGKRRRKCVRAIRSGDRWYMVALGPSAWLKNLRADPNVRLRIPGGSLAGVARELHEAGEREEGAAAYCGTVSWFDYLACRTHRPGRPTRSKVDELLRTWCERGFPLVVEPAERPPSHGPG